MFPDQPSDARRNCLQILSDILEFCQTPTLKTRIMHKTNTNFSQLEKYLQKLQASDLIEKREEIYFTTEKGVGFIKAWVFLQNMLQDVEMPITIRTRIKNVNDRQLLVTA